LPSISLPKGGGAIKGIGEKFFANPVTGTSALSVPLPISPGRAGLQPALALAYDSGAGNGPFGLSWTVAAASITRRTDKGLPQYLDAQDSDTCILAGAEDLVRELRPSVANPGMLEPVSDPRDTPQGRFTVDRFRPRVEGGFARIERWRRESDGTTHWRVISSQNVISLFGTDANSRIADPQDPTRIYSWLLAATYSGKGDAIFYRYKAEDSVGVDALAACERNRSDATRAAQRYLKRVRYGYRRPIGIEEDPEQRTDHMFELVFDFGEHDANVPRPNDAGAWTVRADPFSQYRAGFEVRTYRLCRRVLMFHHFDEDAAVGRDCLVKSLQLAYHPVQGGGYGSYALLSSVTVNGHKRRGADYITRAMPRIDFDYTQTRVTAGQDLSVQVLDLGEGLDNLPAGLDERNFRFVDLDGEGGAGVLVDTGTSLLYKRNLSQLGQGDTLRFGPLEMIEARPNALTLAATARLVDVEGDGALELANFARPLAGYYDREQGWSSFHAFEAMPTLDFASDRVRMLDLTGDGLADVMITEDEVLAWHPSLGRKGFGAAARTPLGHDEEKGPAVVFSGRDETVFLADMSGDGLSDIVRIRNGEVCYWPNLGYGRFGAKVTMDAAPCFAAADEFDPRRLRLVDLDGSGPSDLVYLASDGPRLYFNRSGNAWSAPLPVAGFPRVDNVASFQCIDLLGKGTTCLAWSSPLPGDARRRLCYVDLYQGTKPNLLVRVDNNCGAETVVSYAPSTRFYLADHEAGKPWATRLPFPVQVVERVETRDHISQNLFVTRYAYHHGYFDPHEREFRGFAMVEQWDTEEYATLAGNASLPQPANVAESSHIPPVLTRSWFHNGAFENAERLIAYFREQEFWRDPNPAAMANVSAPLDCFLDPSLSPDEAREASRAMKGKLLRSEVFARDASALEGIPYTITESSYAVRRLQPKVGAGHPVFLVHPRETRTHFLDRAPEKARYAHRFVLAVDAYGNVERAAELAYGRATPDGNLGPIEREKQARAHLVVTTSLYTPVIAPPDVWRTPLPHDQRSYEVTAFPAAAAGFHSFEAMRDLVDDALQHGTVLDPSDVAGSAAAATLSLRLTSAQVSFYRSDMLTGLGYGQSDALGLIEDAVRLAIPASLIAELFVKPGRATAVEMNAFLAEGGYCSTAQLVAQGRVPVGALPDGWWIQSGVARLSPNAADDAAAELAFAKDHFFLPHRAVNPFGATTAISYEDSNRLLALEVVDALGNRVTAGERGLDAGGNPTILPRNDYRLLRPRLVTDPNGNETEVASDAAGQVGAIAVKGKPGKRTGDTLAGLDIDLDEAAIAVHAADPLANAAALLGSASSVYLSDVLGFQRTRATATPLAVATIGHVRTRHVNDPVPTDIQTAIVYSDGLGRAVQTKTLTDDGPLIEGAAPVSPRWLCSGWTVLNNKGQPVRQYEPLFTDQHRFELAVARGVSAISLYDSASRAVAVILPDHSFQKTAFDPWTRAIWDGNDTVDIDPATDVEVGPLVSRLPLADYLPTWQQQHSDPALGAKENAAVAAALAHKNTPTLQHIDSLGRTVLTVADNGGGELHAHRVLLDIAGNTLEVVDALDRVIERNQYDLLGRALRRQSMEAGERVQLPCIDDRSCVAWDSRAHRAHDTYDALRRPRATQVLNADPARPGIEVTVARMVYGESVPGAANDNVLTRVFKCFDGTGEVTTPSYDEAGNVLRVTRRFMLDAAQVPDWDVLAAADGDAFSAQNSYDALSRLDVATAPDGSRIRNMYGRSGAIRRIEVQLPGQGFVPVLKAIERNARGQRIKTAHGNDVVTEATFDAKMFRVRRIRTTRPQAPVVVQDLAFVYDPVGNVTAIVDGGDQSALFQNPVFFANAKITIGADYSYDALYRLITATGREHEGQIGAAWSDAFDGARSLLAHPQDAQRMRSYVETYTYDKAGNLHELAHAAGPQGSWTRSFAYNEPSLIDLPPGVPPPAHPKSNQLSSATVGGNTTSYAYDAHGNMLALDSARTLAWDYGDRLTFADLLGGGSAFYAYDAGGERTRKTWVKSPTLTEERFYLGAFEVWRRRGAGGAIEVERTTLHVMDGRDRCAIIERRTAGVDAGLAELTRFQHANHLGSVALELDAKAAVISYEEFHPYGSTAYEAVAANLGTPKRYRYTGKERDAESGLSYHSARYYAPWLTRWISCDPGGLVDGPNLYRYVAGNPVRSSDRSGRQGDPVPRPDTTVSLGIWRQEGRWVGLWPPTVPSTFGSVAQSFLMADALKNTGQQPILLTQIPGWANTWASVETVVGNPSGQFSGLASGMGVQQVFEGGIAASIHFDVTNVQVLGRGQPPSELRNVITTLQTGGHQQVDVHFYEGGQLSTIRAGSTAVEGAPLPPRIAAHLPNITQPPPNPPPTTGTPPVQGPPPAPVTPPVTPPQQSPPPQGQTSVPASRVTAPPSSGTNRSTPSVTSSSSTRGGGSSVPVSGASLVNTAGGVAANITRQVVPGVAETELALGTTAVYAHAAGYTGVGTALESAAAGVPVVGGGLAVGAVAGNLAEGGLRQAGATDEQAEAGGALAAMAAGAGVGALLGAGPGAAIGALAGLAGYYLFR
jgi:RHS repeat-associated protein